VPHLKRRKEPPAPTRCLTEEEWQRLRAELPEHLRDMADFALATGLRWSNAAILEWSQVSLERKLAWISAHQTTAKTPIGVPLSDTAMEVLRRRGNDGHRVRVHVRRQADRQPQDGLAKDGARGRPSGIPMARPETHWASWHAMNGIPLDVLRQIGGWQTQSMVQRYAHLAPSNLAQFANNGEPMATKVDTGKAKGSFRPRSSVDRATPS
jgi:integrase